MRNEIIEIESQVITETEPVDKKMSELNLISPKQLYEMLNETLDVKIGINTVYA